MDPTLQRIGEQLRRARTASGMTLRQLAGRTGLSPATLCLIEQGKTNPTVHSLTLIAEALNCPTACLLAHDHSEPPADHAAPWRMILPAALRTSVELDGGIRVTSLSPGPATGVNIVEMFYPPGASSGGKPFRHAGREWGLIVEGELTVDLPGERLVLRPGDSIVFDSHQPHRFINAGSVAMRAVWVNFYPPSDGAAPPQEPTRPQRKKRRRR